MENIEKRLCRVEEALYFLADQLKAGPKLAFSVHEAARATCIGQSTLKEEIRAGHLPARKRGSSTIILAEELSAYLARLPQLKLGSVLGPHCP